MNLIKRYTRWLHTGWPAGTVEKLPDVRDDGTTKVPGVRVVGDLTGIPLLKFSADTGAKAVHAILAEPDFAGKRGADDGVYDLAIIGAGVSGMSAAIEAKKAGLRFVIFEASQDFSTIVNFPKGKPIFTYPTEMVPAGDVQFKADIKEALVEELQAQRDQAGIETTRARVEFIERKSGVLNLRVAGGDDIKALRVIVAIGRSGNFRKLGVPGESLDKVYNRLHDPMEFAGKSALVVGGGDSAIECAVALAGAGAQVTLSYRRAELSRAKPENIEQLNNMVADPNTWEGVEEPTSERITTSFTSAMRDGESDGSVQLALATQVAEIRDDAVDLIDESKNVRTIANDVVFSMIGREPPLEFFRRSGIPIRGEWPVSRIVAFSSFMLFCIFLYHWKKELTELPIGTWFRERGWFPANVGGWWDAVGGWVADASRRPTHLFYTLRTSMASAGFYYSLAYCLCVFFFGLRRIRRRKTPYVKLQTWTLIAVQIIPLFLLPEIILPWAGRNGWFADGSAGVAFADQFFERYDDVGIERAYWRAYGFILAWPLFVANVFTDKPMWGWLVIGFLQTFVLIPLIIRRWGKGAYCGWICSCGALAETMGDAHRHKMPHGPKWNRVNMVGQVVLLFVFLLLVLRIVGWAAPGSFANSLYANVYKKIPYLNYTWIVDVMLAGVIGVGCYFWFSGRVWCRFACPLAALMHIYTRFTRFRIFADKKKCISCNVCTSVCHQGIDIMNFANKGLGMRDPECVRCSACVQSCPTGVLTFGRLDASNNPIHDRIAASPVQMQEGRTMVSLPVLGNGASPI
ncbi:MAG: NAD(P)-binding domain-containing protein [Phycisphaerae bacterium]